MVLALSIDLIDWFSYIGEIVTVAFDYFLNIVGSILAAMNLIIASINFPLDLVGFLPSVLGTAVIVTLAIAVINFLIPG